MRSVSSSHPCDAFLTQLKSLERERDLYGLLAMRFPEVSEFHKEVMAQFLQAAMKVSLVFYTSDLMFGRKGLKLTGVDWRPSPNEIQSSWEIKHRRRVKIDIFNPIDRSDTVPFQMTPDSAQALCRLIRKDSAVERLVIFSRPSSETGTQGFDGATLKVLAEELPKNRFSSLKIAGNFTRSDLQEFLKQVPNLLYQGCLTPKAVEFDSILDSPLQGRVSEDPHFRFKSALKRFEETGDLYNLLRLRVPQMSEEKRVPLQRQLESAIRASLSFYTTQLASGQKGINLTGIDYRPDFRRDEAISQDPLTPLDRCSTLPFQISYDGAHAICRVIQEDPQIDCLTLLSYPSRDPSMKDEARNGWLKCLDRDVLNLLVQELPRGRFSVLRIVGAFTYQELVAIAPMIPRLLHPRNCNVELDGVFLSDEAKEKIRDVYIPAIRKKVQAK